MRRDSGLTKDFLFRISRKLSGRSDCKGTEYYVAIDDGKIAMHPDITVFRDTHHRKKMIDECSVVYYVLDKMHTVFNFKDSDLVDGIYVYRYHKNMNRRKWSGLI